MINRDLIEIEDYRGWTIYFNKEEDKFYSVCQADDTSKNNKSFTAAKKAIDDYMKENQTFKPFKVQYNSGAYSRQKYSIAEIVGIRKDGRFMIKEEGKDAEQISQYDERSWIEFKLDNQPIIQEITQLDIEHDRLEKELRLKIDELKARLTYRTVDQIRKELYPTS